LIFYLYSASAWRREDDLEDIHKEVAMLAGCNSPNITTYFASILVPGTSQLLIVMELLAASVADLVCPANSFHTLVDS
jgi:hypothetical protein